VSSRARRLAALGRVAPVTLGFAFGLVAACGLGLGVGSGFRSGGPVPLLAPAP
jgi:hypothetical protein